jgi:hypothetical protein
LPLGEQHGKKNAAEKLSTLHTYEGRTLLGNGVGIGIIGRSKWKLAFPVHRVVLSVCSPYFANALNSGFKEGKTHEFHFEALALRVEQLAEAVGDKSREALGHCAEALTEGQELTVENVGRLGRESGTTVNSSGSGGS